MRKMTFVLLLVVLLVPVSILYAQCEIDLHAEMLTLMSAQIQADTGDTATAAAILQELSATLSTIAEDCASTSSELELRQQYVAQDNSIAFRYPADWVIDASDPFGYILGTSQATLDTAMDSDVPSLNDGEMLIVLFPSSLFGEDFKSLAGDMSDDFLGSEFDVIESLTPTIIVGREAFRGVYEYEGELRVIIEVINYSDAEEPSVIILFGISKVADAALIQSHMTAIAESIQYPPQEEVQLPETEITSLTYIDAFPITDLDSAIDPTVAALSPDGTRIAWYNDGDTSALCFYHFDTDDTRCLPLDEAEIGGKPIFLYWSPDSRYIAFVSDMLRTLEDGDVWLYDSTNNSVRNLTDDGVRGSTLRPEPPLPMLMDATITWGADNQLYIYRSVWDRSTSTPLEDSPEYIIRVSPQTGATEIIRDMTTLFWFVPVIPNPTFALDGSLSVSPDVSQIAFIAYEAINNPEASGIWVMDLSDTAELRQVASFDDFYAGIPSNLTQLRSRNPKGIAWNADGTGLYVWAGGNPDDARSYYVLYYVDVVSGDVTVLTDLSYIPSSEILQVREDGLAPIFEMPRFPVLLPDNQGLLVLNADARQFGLTLLQPSASNSQAQLLFGPAPLPQTQGVGATVSQDNKVLANGILFMPTAP